MNNQFIVMTMNIASPDGKVFLASAGGATTNGRPP
jgi:hypothetical protein